MAAATRRRPGASRYRGRPNPWTPERDAALEQLRASGVPPRQQLAEVNAPPGPPVPSVAALNRRANERGLPSLARKPAPPPRSRRPRRPAHPQPQPHRERRMTHAAPPPLPPPFAVPGRPRPADADPILAAPAVEPENACDEDGLGFARGLLTALLIQIVICAIVWFGLRVALGAPAAASDTAVALRIPASAFRTVVVVNADTVDIPLGAGAWMRARLADIDAPERHGRCPEEAALAAEATDWLSRRVAAGVPAAGVVRIVGIPAGLASAQRPAIEGAVA